MHFGDRYHASNTVYLVVEADQTADYNRPRVLRRSDCRD
jgi:hypothetical protein